MTEKTSEPTTKWVWDDIYEVYRCENCGSGVWTPQDFKYCPFCGRKVEPCGEVAE